MRSRLLRGCAACHDRAVLAHPVGEPFPGGARFAGGLPIGGTPVDRPNSVRASRDMRELPELLHAAIVVGSVIAAMYGLFDLFNVA